MARTERRQVTDLPEQIRALVTEHRITSRRCSCGTVTAGKAPPGVAAPVQYGPRLSAACTYLWHGQFLSRDRTCQAASELFGVPVSPGAVTGMFRNDLLERWPEIRYIEVMQEDDNGQRTAGNVRFVEDGREATDGEFTNVMVRLKTPELDIVDTLIAAGIAGNRAEAIRWALTRVRERPAYEQLREHTRDIERLKNDL